MASGTSRGLTHSVINASAEVIEHPCSFCLSRDSREVESTNTCVDCDSSLCAKCTTWHAGLPIMASHQVVAISTTASGRQKKAPLPTQRCKLHHGKLIDNYCVEHKELACDSCVNLKHRKCDRLQYIPAYAQGTTKGPAFKAVLDSNQTLLKDLQQTRSSQQTTLKKLDAAELQCQQSIQAKRDMLVKMIDQRANDDKKKVKEKFRAEREVVKKNIAAADGHIDAAVEIIKVLNEAKEENESELFVSMKQGETTQHDGEKLIRTMGQFRKVIPKFQLHNKIEMSLEQIKNLGDFVVEHVSHHPLTVKLKNEPKVKTSEDKTGCSIQGVCLLPDGSTMITDYFNKCLKQLDTSYQVTRQLDMGTAVCDVCYTNNKDEVAVTLTGEKTVQFVRVGASLKKICSFTVGDFCLGIACSRGELFVACGSVSNPTGGNVRVFSLSGTPVRTIQQGPEGQNIFSVLDSISISSCGNILHITDRIKGIISTDRTGNLLTTFSGPDLESAAGICALDNDDLLVIGFNSNTIVHVSRDGRKLGVVLSEKDGIVKPMTLSYDHVNARLIVTTASSDTIKVYDVHMQ